MQAKSCWASYWSVWWFTVGIIYGILENAE